MSRVVFVLVALLLILPTAHSLSIKELISRYSFSASAPEMNITSQNDFMVDSNDNGLDDTLVFELTTSNIAGNYIFVINLLDKNGIITNETTATLPTGTNKINLTFSSILLNQNEFNYSIKVYNSNYSLKYRKDNLLTQNYLTYETGFEILNINDFKNDKTLTINITLNSTVDGIFETALFLSYNLSVISIKENKSITNSINDLIFNVNNETIKRTHYSGNFNLQSLKIGKKIIKLNHTTSSYDFRDFAETSYIDDFTDNGVDLNNNGKYDLLQITADARIFQDDYYTITVGLYDLFGNLAGAKTETFFLNSGNKQISMLFNGSKIYNKKLNGPFVVKYAKMLQNNISIDEIKDAYATQNYNFNDFEAPAMPDLAADISISGEYKYGINNATINITFKNIGSRHAFNVFTEIFDNSTFSKNDKTNVLMPNSEMIYSYNFTNFPDFEITAIADSENFVEESDEINNAQRLVVKLNNKPILAPVSNLTAKETELIILNLSAFDADNDNLSFSINSSKFLKNNNIFIWNTTKNDSGYYSFMATVSDGFLDDSAIFNIAVLDLVENDMDKDGINDSIDTLLGDSSFVNTSTINLTILVNGSTDLSKLFDKVLDVKFVDSNATIMLLEFDFSHYKLNLSKMTINKQEINKTGSLLVKGLEMPQGRTKTMYVDRIDKTTTDVCIKDIQIQSTGEISKKCNLKNEIKLKCNGHKKESYRCTYNETTNKYKIQGLKHSGIVQMVHNTGNPITNETKKEEVKNKEKPKIFYNIRNFFSRIFK